MVSYQVGKVTLSGGAYVSNRVIERLSGSYVLANTTDNHALSFADRGYKDLDAGFVAAVMYAVTPRFSIDLRYSQGLRAIAKPYLIDSFGYNGDSYSEIIYNQSAQLAARYSLTR